MASQLPPSPISFLQAARQFWTEISETKRLNRLQGGEWYPYDTLSSLDTIASLVGEHWTEITHFAHSSRVVDVGCGDGDYAFLFARFGCAVDAIDFIPNNFNRMKGVETLGRLLGLSTRIFSLDLNRTSDLPDSSYGLAIVLGTLYHLKNPYGFLENLAHQTRWCVLSTRIAQRTPRSLTRVENEPIAYLADGREIGGDATNFWIFSASGLLRILQRTRWAIAGTQRVGCLKDSNPVDPNSDERMFLLLKSRVYFPELQVRLLDGWYAVENAFRWTMKAFSIEIVLPLEKPLSTFSLQVIIPEALVLSKRVLGLSSRIGDHSVGTHEYDQPGLHMFVGQLPQFSLHEPVLRLTFEVRSDFEPSNGELRELGICVPLMNADPNAIAFHVF